jgi:hypothetical protein
MTDAQFVELLKSTPQNANIQKYLMVTRAKLSEYNRIAVSYSSGSDSDTMLDMIELVKPDDCGVIRYVFFNTGLEYDATLQHVKEIEKRYGVIIEERKPKLSIPAACAKYGMPFISKDVSVMLGLLQRHNFDWKETPESATTDKYGRCKSGLDWYFCRRPRAKSGKKKYDISRHRLLKKFLSKYPPMFNVSDKCCDYAKKMLLKNLTTNTNQMYV